MRPPSLLRKGSSMALAPLPAPTARPGLAFFFELTIACRAVCFFARRVSFQTVPKVLEGAA